MINTILRRDLDDTTDDPTSVPDGSEAVTQAEEVEKTYQNIKEFVVGSGEICQILLANALNVNF